MEVGLVARILGWKRDGVLVLELYDTVAHKSFLIQWSLIILLGR